MKKIKILYICAAILIIGIFLAILYQPIQGVLHEQDLWWMVPLMTSITHAHPFLENMRIFFFDPYLTLQGDTWMNTYLYVILSTVGFQAKYFIFVSLVFHFLCAFLLYSILRKLTLDFRIAFFSALLYLTAFIHFCDYIWPMASHHLFVVFFSLSVIYLYFATNERIDNNRKWRHIFWATICVNFLASFCQITIMLLPAGILAHILIASKDEEDRLKKYDIWMPLFITYLGYPLLRFVYVGYVHLQTFFLNGLYLSNNLVLFILFFLSGIGALFILRGILKLTCTYRPDRILQKFFILAIISYTAIFLAACCRYNLVIGPHKVALYKLLSPYNFIYPICVIFSSFMAPIKTALSIDPAVAYHMISFGTNIIGNLAASLFVIIFIVKYFPKYKALIVFAVFYIVALRYMRIDTVRVPSRHFIYIMPLFSIIFCSSFIYLYDLIANKIKFNKNAREIVLVLIFIGLFIPNILAIKLEIFRGRMVNTFLVYDYIRTTNIVKDDIRSRGTGKSIKASDIFIDGIRPMPFNVDEYWYPAADDPLRFSAFHYLFAQIFNDKSMLDVNVNESAGTAGGLIYKIKDPGIYDSKGSNIDKFSSSFNEAINELKSGNNEKASALFKKAIKTRPFLLNYILARHELKDLRQITGGSDLKTWIDNITDYYTNDKAVCNNERFHVAKIKYVLSVIKNESDTYIECLFYEAYLEYLSGNLKESNALLSQIGILQSDYNKLISLLDKESPVRLDRKMHDFLQNIAKTHIHS